MPRKTRRRRWKIDKMKILRLALKLLSFLMILVYILNLEGKIKALEEQNKYLLRQNTEIYLNIEKHDQSIARLEKAYAYLYQNKTQTEQKNIEYVNPIPSSSKVGVPSTQYEPVFMSNANGLYITAILAGAATFIKKLVFQ